MNEKTLNEDWDVLTSFFPEGWEDKAFETGALLRRRKIDSPKTLLRLLLIHLADGMSLRTTSAYAREANLCDINDAALLHRLRSSGEWLRWMAASLYENSVIQIRPFGFAAKHRVRLIDASLISEPGSTGSDWRLHYSINLEDLYCDTFEVTDKHTGESFRNFQAQSHDLLVADRGYCNRRGILHVVNQDADVLVRFNSTTLPLFNHRGGRVRVLDKLRTLKGKSVGDWNVYLTNDNGEKVSGRLCAIRKSRESIEKAHKKILQDASKKQRTPKPETFEYAEYVILFTTVNRHRLKKNDVMELYRARWQIELSFKRLKGIMKLGHLHKIDPESCKAWLHGKMFVAMLVESIYQEAEFFSPWGYPLEKLRK